MSKQYLMRSMVQFDKILTKTTTNIGIFFYGCMIVLILFGIVMRFLLRLPNIYGEELSMHCLFISTMMGISLGVQSKSHLGIESFVSSLPDTIRGKVKSFVDIIVAMMLGFLCTVAFQLAMQSMQFGAETAAVRLPFYYIYFTMAIVFALCVIQKILLFINDHVLDEPVLKIEGGGTLS